MLLAIVLVAQCGLVLSQVGGRHTGPHEVRVLVQGPAVVAQEIVTEVDRLAGRPLRAQVLPAGADPEGPVRDGEAAGALVVDITSTHDVLYLSSVADPELTRVLRVFAQRVGTPLDRPHVTHVVAPQAHPGVTRATLTLAVACWLLGGFLLAVVLALARPGWSLGRRAGALLSGVALLSLLVGAMVSVRGGSFGVSWALGAVAMSTTAATTSAVMVLLGLVGTSVASTVLVLLSAPLFSGHDPRLLPTPWRQVVPWTPHGAASDLASAFTWYDGQDVARPLLVLGCYLLVGLVAWAVASTSPTTTTRGPARWHAAALAVPLALTIVVAVLLAPTETAIVSADPVQGASQTSCLPRHEVTSVDQLNKQILSVRAGSSFQGADVGADVELQDGRRLWLFGDTLRAPDFDGQEFVRNSMLVFDPHCLETVLPADHGALIPDRRDGVGYWPMSVARVQRKGYDLVGVATQRVRTTDKPDGAFAFEALGPALALFVVPRGKAPQLLVNQDIGPDEVGTTRPMWGAAATIVGDWMYLYGTAHPSTPGVFGFSLRVARTKVTDLLHSDRWQYWDGHSWQHDASRAKMLIPAQGGVSQTLSVFERGGRWYAVSKRDEFLGTDLVVWKARSPTGPFDSGTKVASLPSDLQSGALRYMPLAHPALLADPGSVLVSYSRNNTDAAKVEGDPFLYRPLFLRVRLP